MQQGEVVLVAFPYVSGGGGKNRPALIIQTDRNNQRLANTIVAMITGNTRLATTEPTQRNWWNAPLPGSDGLR